MRRSFWFAAVLVGGLVVSLLGEASAQVKVDGYFHKNGTYVQPHYRSAPNNTPYDNWSTRPNVNPYTGQPGTQNPYYVPPPTYPRPAQRFGY